MKSWVKKTIRKYAPAYLYSVLYINYQKLIDSGLSYEKIQKYAKFTKKGVYEFNLEEVKYKIFLDPSNGGVDSEIYSDGCYEPGILKLLSQNLKKESIFIDIGANIGQHSLYASFFCRKIHSFEPIKKIYDQFSESIKINDIVNIKTYNFALGNTEKVLPIYGDDRNMGASSVIERKSTHKIQDISIKRLDDIYEDLGITRVDLIKIDVEGYEFDVLVGAKKLIEKYRPIIILEFSPYLYNKIDQRISTEIIKILSSVGYDIFDVGDGTEKIKISEENIEKIINSDQTNIMCIHNSN